MIGNALWHLIAQSDWIAKGVLLVLLIMSVVCWTLFFYKLITLNAKIKQIKNIMGALQQQTLLDEVYNLASRNGHTFPGYVLTSILSYLKGILSTNKSQGMMHLSALQQERAHEYGYQVLDDAIAHEESMLPILSASAALSPLLGLFGTVWGLVHAFIGIAQKQSADIATVAPGIAEALITTLAGLIVAIPSLAMYVYLQSKVRQLEQVGTQLIESMNRIVQRLVA